MMHDAPLVGFWVREHEEWESMEANIFSAENEVSDLEATFAAPDFYAKPRAEIFEWSEGGERHVRYSRDG